MAMTKVGAVSVDDDCVVEHDEYGPCEPADVVPKLEEPEVDEPLASADASPGHGTEGSGMLAELPADLGDDSGGRGAKEDPAELALQAASPSRRGGGIRASDIWTGPEQFLADAIQQKFWRGEIFLATRQEVEDSSWRAANGIGFVVSAGGGAFTLAEHGRQCFAYADDCLAMNVPVMVEDFSEWIAPAVMMMMAALGQRKNVAISDSVEHGPLVLMAFLAMVKGTDQEDMADDEGSVARRSAALMSHVKQRWPQVSEPARACSSACGSAVPAPLAALPPRRGDLPPRRVRGPSAG